ncbi:MAG: ISL3 family transposase [Dehalococcoidales bacterium]|nr:ISL3 family transposase [Dehalococcoidales bacterium]
MQDDCIAVALGLPQVRILKQEELGSHFEVTVIYRRKGAVCPRCGMTTTKEHDRRPQHKQDRRLRDKVVFLTLIKRRFRCPWCGKVFTEPDEVFGPRRRSSHRFRKYLGQEALHQTVRRTAQKEKVVEGQGQQKVEEYLDKLPDSERVKGVVIDRHEPFRQAVQMCLPLARVVVDKFHLIRHINGALDKVRSRLQGGNRRGKRRDLFRNRYTLLKGTERLADWEKAKLNQLFYRYPELGRAWTFKESFRAWYRGADRNKAEERLASLEKTISHDSLPEFKQLLHTLDNWREEILNYFDCPITNGFVEGKNNRVKTIKRMAYPSREGPEYG